MNVILKNIVSILSFTILFLSTNISHAGNEEPLLLALKLECSADKKGKKAYDDYFFGFTTEHAFHGSRWWNGTGKRDGQIGLSTFDGLRTKKSLLIEGEGKWLENKGKKPWKYQFVSKGDKPIIEHLSLGVEGYEGSGQNRRECKLKLLNNVKASEAIQLNSYTKVISGLRNKIDKINETNDELNILNKDFKQRINTLDDLIVSLKNEKTINQEKIINLNNDIEKAKNNTEFQKKYEDLKNQIQDYTRELETSNSKIENLEKEILSFMNSEDDLLKSIGNKNNEIEKLEKEILSFINSEDDLLKSIDDKNNEIETLQNINLTLKKEIEIIEKKENELIEIVKASETQKKEEQELAKKKKEEEDKLAEEKRQAEEKKLKEKEELEKLAKEELNQKLALLTQETDLEKAQNFLINLEKFIKQYPNEFDIIKISEYFIATRPILDGNLNSASKTKLQEFKDYVSETSELYSEYSSEISQKSQNEKLDKINEAILSLETAISELKIVMVNNPQSENLQNWTDTIIQAQKSLSELKSLEDIINSKNNIDDLIQLKTEVDASIIILNETKDELKLLLQENLTTDKAPLILKQIELIEDAIKKENIETINNTNEETKDFIFKNFIEPEEKRKAEEIEEERIKLIEEKNEKFEEIFTKHNAKNDYQKQIVKFLNFLPISFEKIEFSKRDTVIKIYNITDESNSFNLNELRITKVNKKYLENWFKINEKYDYLIDVSDFNELPKLEYLGEIAEGINFYGLKDYSILRGDTTFEEIGINGLDFSSFDKLKSTINSSLINENDKHLLSLILSSKFDKFYIKNYAKSEYDPVSIKYFEIANWNEFSFENIEIQDFKIEEESNKLYLEKFIVSNFFLDNNSIQDLLSSEETQQLLLSGDYSEIFNSFVSLDNLEINNFKANIDNQDVFILDNAKINDIKFDYFGANNDIKVPTSFNFEINGADFNYDQVRELNQEFPFLDGLIDELGYEKIKFDFQTGWKWNTKKNDITFDLDLGITDAASLGISTQLVDLDTNILTLQGAPLLTYLMTTPKLSEFSLSFTDSSLRDKLLDYAAKEQNMTANQLTDFAIQTMDIYSMTLGIDQGLVKEFLDATSNFINGSDKIVLSVNPPNPVSISELTPDVIGQNYVGLIKKLNITFKN